MNSIKATYLKWKSKLIAGFSIALIAVALLNIYFVLEVRVTSNDECLWIPKKINKDSTAIFFDLVKVDGVTWNAGIRNGDQLLMINGETLNYTLQAQEILNRVKGGEYADYAIQKPDEEIVTTKVYIKKLIQYGTLAGSLSALFWMLIGFIVLTAKPEGRTHKLFYALGVFAVFTSMAVLMQLDYRLIDHVKEQPVFSFLISSIWVIGISFVGPTLLNFVWNFPRPFKFAEKLWVRRTLVILPSIVSLLLITFLVLSFGYYILPMGNFYLFLNWFGNFIMAVYAVALISLIIQYRRIKNKEQKKPIFLFIVAFIFGIAVSVYASKIAPAITDTIFNSPEYYAPIVLIALVPLIFGYAIFKYQLMDVSVVIKNTIMYGAATLTLAAIYFFVVYVAGQGISSVLGVENQGIIAGIFFIIFALIFQSTKNRFQDFLTKRFYPEQFAHQRVLMELSNELATVVGLDNILELMKKTFVDALNINKFGILIRDKDNNLSLTKCVGINEECIITSSNIAQFLKERSLITKNPAIEQADFKSVFPDMADKLIEEEIYTVIPMIINNKIVGLLLFGLKYSGSHFAGKDIELLWAAANQAAVSIENARLYDTEAQKLKIEQDLDTARKIQESLLPACIPEIRNLDICGEMIPAMQVGGDYYDLLPVNGSDSKLYVIIGDVSGKGLAASLYMTKLQTMVQFACTSDTSPKEILVEINKRIYGEMERNWFITMSIAYFDLEKNIVKFCRAGHMPLLTAINGTVQSHRTQGIGVGLEKGNIFEKSLMEEELELKPGQTFAFFTDGITEAMNEQQDMFGEDKLSSILKSKSFQRSTEIMDEIWSSINTFRGTAEVNDDMTMVIVKVK
ncbi:MAG: SpoIIE family protein phosphatase [Bacteroidetes bacterium]|nr:SpoIIE family protein phosphatase [Bacteroidota bacterium]